MHTITLHCTEGGSDKLYRIELQEEKTGWLVNFVYGRRGSTLNTGTKTPQPVPRDKADWIYNRLLREKLAKGYYPVGELVGYQAPFTTEDTGVRPQLLNPVDQSDLEHLLADEDFVLQPKIDGKRMLLLKRGNIITGVNRRGFQCAVPHSLVEAALQLPGNFILDGEAVGECLHVFDLLEVDGKDIRSHSYRKRLVALLNLLATGHQQHIKWVTTHHGESMKRKLFDQLHQEGAEGVVFKNQNAPFSAGRPASGGDQLKFKFVKTASMVVMMIHPDRRSVAIGLMDRRKLRVTGHVAIPVNQEIPSIGQVVEVRYLYAMPGTDALYQPVYLGMRSDVTQAECTRSQLHIKADLIAT